MRSILIPRLGEFARRHPSVRVDVMTRQVRDLPALLRTGEADFVLTTGALDRSGVECRKIGEERNVLIESPLKGARHDIYLDHDEEDRTTADFWKAQKRAPSTYSRAYYDEIYALIDAVRAGLGRAVVPLHLIEEGPRVRVVSGLKPLVTPVYLAYVRQDYRPRLHETLVEVLTDAWAAD